MDYSAEERKFLRVANIIFEICYVLIVLFIVHNIIKYVIGLKMRQPLIWAFYILLLTFTVSNMIDAANSIKYPAETLQIFGLWSEFELGLFGNFTCLCMVITLILTVNKLQLALKLLIGQINLR